MPFSPYGTGIVIIQMFVAKVMVVPKQIAQENHYTKLFTKNILTQLAKMKLTDCSCIDINFAVNRTANDLRKTP